MLPRPPSSTPFPTRRSSDLEPAWRFPLRGGRGVTVGALVVRDADGRELHRALPSLAGSRLSLTVPGRVLRSAAYPLTRSEEHTSELQSHSDLVCRLLLEKKK